MLNLIKTGSGAASVVPKVVGGAIKAALKKAVIKGVEPKQQPKGPVALKLHAIAQGAIKGSVPQGKVLPKNLNMLGGGGASVSPIKKALLKTK